MVQRNERDLMATFSSLTSDIGSNYLDTGGELCLRLCEIHEVLSENAFTNKPYEITESLYFHTYLHLQDFLSVLQPGQMTILRNPKAEDIEPKRNRDLLSPKEKSNEDRDILWGKCKHNVSFDRYGADLPPLNLETAPIGLAISAKDRITHGILEAQTSGKIPIWLVFAVQELLDIFHITRKDRGKALIELRLNATKIENSLKEYYAYSRIQYSKS
jgi:hypothetical protein